MSTFNGYIVRLFNHETREEQTDEYLTPKSILSKGFEELEGALPSAEEFADELYEVFGDTVHTIRDRDGVLLYRDQYAANPAPDEAIQNYLDGIGLHGNAFILEQNRSEFLNRRELEVYQRALQDAIVVIRQAFKITENASE